MLENLRDLIEDLLHNDPRGQKPSWEHANRIVDEAIATALAEAEARGRRQGLEEAAKHFDGLAAAADAKTMAAWTDTEAGEGIRAMGEAKRAAKAVRNLLATTPAETQKPETGEGGHG